MFNSYKEINVGWLKNNAKIIHYFGWFIQIKIDEIYRLHFYAPKLPTIMSEEEIHNHRYNFSSKILKGQLKQDIYQVQKYNNMGWVLEQESCNEANKTINQPIPCDVKFLISNKYTAGSEYIIDHDTFHTVEAECCITLLKRSDYKKELADVVRKIDSEKICPFSKKVPEEELWRIVEEMLR